jgi:putative two-component system response regulator
MQNTTTKNAKILIVDDQVINIELLGTILSKAGYANLSSTSDPREVFSLCTTLQPDLILLDLMMPHMSGFEVMQALRPLIPEGSYLPILVLTADVTTETKQKALSAGATDFVTKPFDRTEVLLRIENLLETYFLHLQLQDQNQILEEKVRERTKELEGARRELDEAQIEILERLALAAEYRDDDTGQHTRRVSDLCALVAQALGLPDDQVELIRRTAPLHDVGKIGISDEILLKPGKLTASEFQVIRTHTVIGARILSGGQSVLVKMAQSIALTHHERWDGSGYPGGLVGEAIPLPGRIVAIADVFDALTHTRPYKQAWPIEEAVAEIMYQSGTQFDPRVVEAFMRVLEQEGIYSETFASSEPLIEVG